MNELWLVTRFLLDQAHSRIKAALQGEAGALSLEWIVIAVALAAAALAVGGYITASILRESAKLP
jgi:hypothetical protein